MSIMSLGHVVLACCLTFPIGAAAAGPPERGFVQIPGLQGPSNDPQHHHWFDLAQHDIEVGEAGQCKVTLRADLDTAAPQLLRDVGDALDDVKIELQRTTKGAIVYYEATLVSPTIRRVNSLSLDGSDSAVLELAPQSISIRVREFKPDGSVGPGGASTISCGGR